ncbi:MAG: hypothetical protein A4E64_00455 [Syntrophorhabdus sp. PtaU1.Bin058]|nr:MAG: hypothetical protein A4E64_00455 [Syntrophorhabdus sp. PtaU1.Bin058]
MYPAIAFKGPVLMKTLRFLNIAVTLLCYLLTNYQDYYGWFDGRVN